MPIAWTAPRQRKIRSGRSRVHATKSLEFRIITKRDMYDSANCVGCAMTGEIK